MRHQRGFEQQVRRREVPGSKIVALMVAFLVAATSGGVLAAGLAIPAAGIAHAVSNKVVEIFDALPYYLERGELAQVSTVHASDGSLLATFFQQNRIEVPLSQISQHMIDAVVAIEDERFFEHHGVDVRGVTRALVNNATGGDLQGASTITMQYVKNRLIDAAYRVGDWEGVAEAQDQSLSRKAREAAMAIALEQRVSKEEILEGYLNLSQFGFGVFFGVEAAARYFFNTTAAELTIIQAATIAGITNAPAHFDPTRNPRASEHRRNLVLHRMYENGFISRAEFDEARVIPVEDTLDRTPVPRGCMVAEGSAVFCDYVIRTILTSPEFGATHAERHELLNRGGLRIYTTLDPRLQEIAVEEVTRQVPAGNSAELEAAIVTVEPGTGRILAMAQNVPFDNRQDPADGTTALNYSAGPLLGASRGFQSGSVFKNFVLAEWLNQGRTLREHVNASRVVRPQSAWTASCAQFGGAPWGPRNAEGHEFGPTTVMRASYRSVNTAFATMSTQVDLCGVRDTAWAMGFRPTTRTVGGGAVVLEHPTVDDVEVTPAMIMGTQGTTPLYIANAHATVAANGTFCEPYAITRVVGPDGRELPIPGQSCTPGALEPNVAATLTYALRYTMTHGTGRRSQLAGGRPSAGKTGTSQGSAHTWFVGYTPELSTAVWVGEADGDTTNFNIRHPVTNRHIRTLFGSTLAAPLWATFMDRALEGQPHGQFEAPDPRLVGRYRPIVTEPDPSEYEAAPPADAPAPPVEQPAPPAEQPAPPAEPEPPAYTPEQAAPAPGDGGGDGY